MKYKAPPLKPLKDGSHVMRLHIEPQFMKMAKRAEDVCLIPPEDYFSCLFNDLLRRELEEFEERYKPAPLGPSAVVYPFRRNGRGPA